MGAIGVRGTIVEGVVGPEARDVLDGERGLPRPPRDLSAATLVVLRGPGPKNQGSDRPGAIDFTVNGRLTPVEQAGMAVLVWGPGQPPFGPFRLSDVASARLTNLLAPPGPDWRKAERDRRAAAGAAVGFLFGAAGHHDNGSGQTTPSGPNRR